MVSPLGKHCTQSGNKQRGGCKFGHHGSSSQNGKWHCAFSPPPFPLPPPPSLLPPSFPFLFHVLVLFSLHFNTLTKLPYMHLFTQNSCNTLKNREKNVRKLEHMKGSTNLTDWTIQLMQISHRI